MSYVVLARKYRPKSFADVLGQDVILKTLQQAIASGRVAHAFLFTGSRGVGKTTMARLLAKALNCESPLPSGEPCLACTQCTQIAQGTSLDVIEIDGASNTGVDDIRVLRENVRYQPSSARYKIFIIDEVHMLSTSAFNALLKTLEEPPPHAKFIFATTESHKIPATILSRCQRYDFKRLPTQVIFEKLKNIVASEGLAVEEEGLALIARSAEGGMRDAESLLDQVLSFSAGPVTATEVQHILGRVDRRALLALIDAMIAGQTEQAFTLTTQMLQGSIDIKQLLDDIALEFRHLAVAASTGALPEPVDLSEDEQRDLLARAKSQDSQDMQRLFAMALDGIDKVSGALRPRLCLELVLLHMADRPPMSDTFTIGNAIHRLEALARGQVAAPATPPVAQPSPRVPAMPAAASALPISTPASVPTTPALPAAVPTPAAPTPLPTLTPTPSPAPTPAATPTLYEALNSGVDLDPVMSDEDSRLRVNDRWLKFVLKIAELSAPLGAHLEHGRFLEVADERSTRPIVRVHFMQQLHYERVTKASQNPRLLKPLESIFGSGARLELSLGDSEDNHKLTINEARGVAKTEAQQALEAEAAAHPVVQRAIALFGGDIRSVRSLNN
jgi:DNA polymerase-3 subunit gamma/tau